MNILFWLIVAGLVILAVLILVVPLLNNKPLTIANGEQRNVKIARQQLADLKQQLQDDLLSASQYAEQYQELKLSLNDNLLDADQQESQPSSGRWIIPLVVLLVPMLSLFLYFFLADPDSLQKAEIQQANDKTNADVRALIPKIIERLKENPNDLQGWLMLGRSYQHLQQFQEATNVFAKLNQIQPDNPEVLLNYAESLAMNRNGQLAGEPAALAYQAVKLAPQNKDALWMAGIAKAEEGDPSQAISYWQTLAGLLPEDSSALQEVKKMIAVASVQEAQPAAGAIPSAINIPVQVSIDVALKDQVQAEQTVFIYAQALNGPKMPLAIVRKQVADLPIKVDLNDSLAMQPNMHLADFKQLKIVARISKSGNASTQSGDFIGVMELNLPVNDQVVSVIINQQVK